jgi:prepilin peptidase CpaA
VPAGIPGRSGFLNSILNECGIVQESPDIIVLVALFCTMAVALFTDLRSRKIPNRLTYPAMVFMLAYCGAAHGFEGLWFSFTGLLLGTGLLMPLYFLGGMGAGDAKLMGAAGAALGMRGVFSVFLFTALIGGAYALVLIAFRLESCRRLLERSALMMKVFVYTQRFVFIPGAQSEQAPKLCYAIPIAAGTAAAVAWRFAYGSYII